MGEEYVAVVVSFGRRDLVERVLRDLAMQSSPPSLVVVVDNAGDLDWTDFVATNPSLSLSLIRRPDNPGYSAAVNEARNLLGPALSRLLVLTHDTEFSHDMAATLLAALAANPRIGAVAPALMRASDPSVPWSFGGRLTAGGRASHRLRLPRDSSEPVEADWLDGAVMMIRVEALEAIGWLDERYFLYFEDVDLGWRLRSNGWKVAVEPAAVARQEPGSHPTYLGVRNMTLFARTAAISAPRSAASVVSRSTREAIARVLRGKAPEFGETWRGWRDGRRGIDGKPSSRAS